MVDRHELIVRAAGRIGEERLRQAEMSVDAMRAAHNAEGRLKSGLTIRKTQEIVELEFQNACIQMLEKVQFEEHELPMDVAELVRKKTLGPLRRKFSNYYLESMGLPITPPVSPSSMLGRTSMDRAKAQKEMETKLIALEANAVEEFQLAVTRASSRPKLQVHNTSFVDPSRIEALRNSSSIEWDFSRLIALCEELNTCWQHGAHHAVAMLSRALLDHVPPIFGMRTFQEVANNYGPRSFKDIMKGLENVSRSIADGHLHSPIRRSEVLPNSTQVDCRSGIDALLAEIIRTVP